MMSAPDALAQFSVIPTVKTIANGVGGFGGDTGNGRDFGKAVAAIGDLNGDGVQDLAVGSPRDNQNGLKDKGAVWILLMNANGTVKSEVRIQENVGGFTGDIDENDRFGSAIASLGDLDGDGFDEIAVGLPFYSDADPDLFIAGALDTEIHADFYQNDRGVFTFDADYDLDILLVGEGDGGPTALVVRNEVERANTPPRPPAGLETHATGDSVSFVWFPTDDEQTPTQALTYNLRVGTRPNGVDVLSPMSDVESGRRLIVGPGNVGALTQHTIRGLSPDATYYWSVQALDNGYAASAWAPEQTVTPGEATSVTSDESPSSLPLTLYPNYPNPFQSRTTIRYDLAVPAHVRIQIIDVLGRVVDTVVSSRTRPGSYRVT